MQRRRDHKRQRQDRRLGMDELMIVNPARNGIKAVFLDDEGVLRAAHPGPQASADALRIGADGRLYRSAVSLAGPCLRCGASRRRRIRNY